MNPEERREYIKRLVDAAPPLSESQRARLAILFGRSPATTAAEKKATIVEAKAA